MILKITVAEYKDRPVDPPLTAVFDKTGGSLGRAADNHLVLDDSEKYVSTKHADIQCENGEFYYIDTSLNGSLVTKFNQGVHQDTIITKNQDRIKLEDQDELQIGDYKLILNINENVIESVSDQYACSDSTDNKLSLTKFGFDKDEAIKHQPVKSTEKEICDGLRSDVNLPDDFDKAFDPIFDFSKLQNPTDKINVMPEGSAIKNNLKLDDFFPNKKQADIIAEKATVIVKKKEDLTTKDDDTFITERFPPKIKIHKNNADTETNKRALDLLNIFFKAAGIEDRSALAGEDSSELLHNLGLVFRELVEGLVMILRGRAELKSHLRLTMTRLQPNQNNPLKFFPTTEEALIYFLKNRHQGYLDAVDAVREGYEDIVDHQLAINAGVQASLAAILKQFDPKYISHKFKEGIVLNKKARCWDEYQDVYPQFVQKAVEDFFGKAFIHGYENQIEKLKTNRKKKL